MLKKTNLEKITNSLGTNIATTVIATAGTAITPLAVFVPVLCQSLASNRHSKRIDESLNEINQILTNQQELLNNVTDSQYKLIAEAISSIFTTNNVEKLSFLKAAIKNTISNNNINDKNTDFLSRTLRDISVSELNFLIKNFSYTAIFITNNQVKISDGILEITSGSDDEMTLTGLVNLGLMYSKVPVFDGVRYDFSPIVAKLLALIDSD